MKIWFCIVATLAIGILSQETTQSINWIREVDGRKQIQKSQVNGQQEIIVIQPSNQMNTQQTAPKDHQNFQQVKQPIKKQHKPYQKRHTNVQDINDEVSEHKKGHKEHKIYNEHSHQRHSQTHKPQVSQDKWQDSQFDEQQDQDYIKKYHKKHWKKKGKLIGGIAFFIILGLVAIVLLKKCMKKKRKQCKKRFQELKMMSNPTLIDQKINKLYKQIQRLEEMKQTVHQRNNRDHTYEQNPIIYHYVHPQAQFQGRVINENYMPRNQNFQMQSGPIPMGRPVNNQYFSRNGF